MTIFDPYAVQDEIEELEERIALLQEEFLWSLDFLDSVAYPEAQNSLFEFIDKKRQQLLPKVTNYEFKQWDDRFR